MMNKTKKSVILTVAMLCVATVSIAQGGYTIKGKVVNAENKKIYLRYGNNHNIKRDSAIVSKGTFTFNGVMMKPYYSAMLILGNAKDRKGGNILRFYLEPTLITIDADGADFSHAMVKGGKTQQESNDLQMSVKVIEQKIDILDNQYSQVSTAEEREAIKEKMSPYYKQLDEVYTHFYQTHPDSYLSPLYLQRDMTNMTYDQLKNAYDGLSENVRKYGDTEDIRNELVALEKIQPGKTAPDFTTKDINGESFTLSSLRGKIIILDFWASWCVPCRRSNPHMRELYEKYHDKGLELVFVSDDDSKPEAWHAAVEKDGLTGDGYHHVLRGLKIDRSKGLAGIDRTKDISNPYAVHYLPTKFLIGRDGKIICKITEEIERKLDSMLDELCQ